MPAIYERVLNKWDGMMMMIIKLYYLLPSQQHVLFKQVKSE